jgi:hydroxyacylglutathione hydrolase
MDVSRQSNHEAHALRAPCPPDVVVLRTTRGAMTNYNYLVVDPITSKAVLVDPSWQPDIIRRAVESAGALIEGILLTHSHPDHIDLARTMSAHYGCPLWMSKAEIAASGFDAPGLVGIDETPWRVGSMLVTPLLTPGHTPGCICFRIDDSLFTGDVLFAEGCGICPDLDSAHQMYRSLERLKRELSPDTRIYPGHSFGLPPGQRFGHLLQCNMYLHFSDEEKFAAFRLRKDQDRTKFFAFQ